MLQLLHMYQAINIHTNPDITAEFHESKLLPNILGQIIFHFPLLKYKFSNTC